MAKPVNKEGASYKLGFAEGQEVARKEFATHQNGTISELELLDKLLTGLLKRMDAGLAARANGGSDVR